MIKEKIKEGLGAKVLDWQDRSAKKSYFTVDKKDIVETARFLFKDLGLRFITATGTDSLQRLEIIYHFISDPAGEFYSARVFINDKAHPEVPSITPLFPGAEWIEREIWEMLGIVFSGHPNLKRLLLAEDWPEGEHPLRHKT